MQIKKYQARTIKEATAKVKNVLGHDAMIISTKKIKGNGKDGLFEIAAIPPKDNISSEYSDLFGEVKTELMSIKEMLYLVNHCGGYSEKLLLTPGILNLYARMIKNGVDDYYARLFLERSGAFNGHSDDGLNNFKEKVFKEIMQVIKTKDPFDVADNRRLIAAFIGTTGVGKTTTIAKLAAQLMLKSGKKVGLISIDAYRIGAMEQLKTYADILGIPCFRAFKKKDLLFALKNMEGKNVILIDTAGQSQYDMSRIEELKRMMPGDMNISTHLLLSVATRESEMNKAAVNFSALNYLSYIFTKTDETERCGSIINQVMKLNLPISYITNGQKVPEDIERADKEKILKLLLSKN
ncbi:MAG: protein FlhF [Deltaproteobacteria bacterium]|nr:protein FlhF [Deltaproteobacteria bacterium]MBW2641054.1 protein FlhF [Deltaproteobacteria bacterium]